MHSYREAFQKRLGSSKNFGLVSLLLQITKGLKCKAMDLSIGLYISNISSYINVTMHGISLEWNHKTGIVASKAVIKHMHCKALFYYLIRHSVPP